MVLKAGADPNAEDLKGHTVLALYLERSQREERVPDRRVVKALLEARADPNALVEDSSSYIIGKSPLLHYLAGGTKVKEEQALENLLLLRNLLLAGADPSRENAMGRRFLSVLAWTGAFLRPEPKTDVERRARKVFTDVVRLALEKGDFLDAPDGSGRSPMHYAAEYASYGGLPLEVYLEMGGNPNAVDRWGSTPAHFLAAFGKIDGFIRLVKRGADLYIRDHDGNTPLGLFFARRAGELDVSLLYRFMLNPSQYPFEYCGPLPVVGT